MKSGSRRNRNRHGSIPRNRPDSSLNEERFPEEPQRPISSSWVVCGSPRLNEERFPEEPQPVEVGVGELLAAGEASMKSGSRRNRNSDGGIAARSSARPQ